MKTSKRKIDRLIVLSLVPVFFLLIGCKKDSDEPDNTKTPVWIYDTGEDPYQSKPCVSGDKVIFCTMPKDGDNITDPGTHCINRNTGTLIWKINDTVGSMVTSPLVYGQYILKGGLNPHARNLNDGHLEWLFADDTIKHSLYSSPLIVGDAAYFACMFHIVKLNAASGGKVWKTNGEYFNLRLSPPVFKNDRLYYADGVLNMVTSLIEGSGMVEWAVPFEAPFTNKPFVTDNEIFVGIQDASISTNTLRCLRLSDQTEKWAVKIGIVFSDLLVADGRVYAVGQNTVHCRSAADGASIWQYSMSAGTVAEPVVTNNKLFIGNGDGFMCFNASTGEVLWEYHTENDNGFSSATLDGDRIYVSSDDGKVYCFSVD